MPLYDAQSRGGNSRTIADDLISQYFMQMWEAEGGRVVILLAHIYVITAHFYWFIDFKSYIRRSRRI